MLTIRSNTRSHQTRSRPPTRDQAALAQSWRDIAARVQGLDGPSAEIDASVFVLLNPIYRLHADGSKTSTSLTCGDLIWDAADLVPPVSTSVSLVVSLIQARLPGWGYELRHGIGELPRAWLIDTTEIQDWECSGATAALALLGSFCLGVADVALSWGTDR